MLLTVTNCQRKQLYARTERKTEEWQVRKGEMSDLKFCPLLVGKEEHKAIAIGQGDIVVPILYPCIEDSCIAYKDGECQIYNNPVTLDKDLRKALAVY